MFIDTQSTTFVSLPDSIFTSNDSFDYSDEEENTYNVLQGNLSDWWNKV